MTASTGNIPGRIFISYRREETAYPAGWLFDRLSSHFGRDQIFKDVNSIELGDDFVEVITSAVGSCEVLLALIGKRWLAITDPDGQRRLDSPDDFVRLEIEAALTRNVRIIPILVDGARMPPGSELPASLAKLVRREALELSPNRFDSDTQRLLNVLDRTVAEAKERARREAEQAKSQLQVDELLQSFLENPRASYDDEMLLIDSTQFPPANSLLTFEINELDDRDLGRYFKAIWIRLSWMLQLADNIMSHHDARAEDSYPEIKELKERAESWGGNALTRALGVWLNTNRALRNQGWQAYNTWSDMSDEERRGQLKKAQYLLSRLEGELGRHHLTKN